MGYELICDNFEGGGVGLIFIVGNCQAHRRITFCCVGVHCIQVRGRLSVTKILVPAENTSVRIAVLIAQRYLLPVNPIDESCRGAQVVHSPICTV